MKVPSIFVMGRHAAEEFYPGKNDVCISIRCPGEEQPNLSSRFKAILWMEFDDVASKGVGQDITDWQARDIVHFAIQYSEADRIIVHCGAGVSRSVAVGFALSKLGWPVHSRVLAIKNLTVFRAVKRVIADMPVMDGALSGV